MRCELPDLVRCVLTYVPTVVAVTTLVAGTYWGRCHLSLENSLLSKDKYCVEVGEERLGA